MSEARTGLAGRVDEILSELGMRAELDADGDWRVETDAGPFLLVIDRDNGDLVAIQTIRTMAPPLADHADLMYLLMRLNLEAEGAAFGALKDGDTDLLILAARVGAGDVTRDRIAAMLRSATRLSARLDELVGEATADAG
jgi:Putative bacterial sensory transduction regulator